MRTSRSKPTLDEIGVLLAILAVVLGGFLYLYQAASAGFPINDGGLFYTMIRTIQGNGFRLPDSVKYNDLEIPFAYPPLALYAGARISQLLDLDPLTILQWLPAIVLIGISVAVFGLARRILKSSIEAGLATFLYVCTPSSMTWLIMGGGLTRSLGHLFLVLMAASVYALYTDRHWKHLLGSLLFGSLVVVTHPEAALHAAATAVLFWILKGRGRQALVDSFVVASGTAVLTSVWWLPVLIRLGPAPFISAGQTGLHASIIFIYPLVMSFSEEPFMTLIAGLGLIGIIACLARREFLLPAWMFLPFLVEPRGAATVASVPLALMAAIGLHEVIFPGLAAIQASLHKSSIPSYLDSSAVKILAGYTFAFLLIARLYAGTQLAQTTLSGPNRAAFQWIASSTPPHSRFLVMTGDRELFCDPVQEWFPVLAQRTSQTTIQGREWASNGSFFAHEDGLQNLQSCLQADFPLTCVGTTADSLGLTYDYIYVSKVAMTTQFCRLTGQERPGASLIMELTGSEQYESVYRTNDVEIFALRH